MNVKRKGNDGERELLSILQRQGIDCRRNDQRYVGGVNNPDIACRLAGIPVHVEVKRAERLNVSAAMAQAVHDAADGALPVVVHRRNRAPWLVTLRLDDILPVLEGSR